MADRELANINTSGGLNAIQLGDVTSEKKVLTQDEVDAKVAGVLTSVEDISFDPQATLPTYSEALLWYDDTRKALAYYDDVTGDPIHIAQEMLIHVYNNTGSTITAGQVVRYNGIIVHGLPSVVLAQADSIPTAKVLGIVSTDMPTGTSGSIVTDGVLSGFDTSGLVQGERMYLSDTVAGGMTSTPPDIVCLVGGSLESDVDGSFFVSVENYQTLPTAFVSMADGTSAATLGIAWTDIANYATETEVIMSGNPTTGEILIPEAGDYRVTANLCVTFDDIGASPQFVYIRIAGDQGFVGGSIPFSVARNGEGASIYPSVIVPLTAGQNYKIQISASATITGVVYEYTSFEAEAIRISL